MRISLQIPDELHDTYVTRAKTRKRGVAGLMADELRALYPLDLAIDRVVVIDPETRRRIEALLGGGHILDATDLADKLEKLLSINVGGFSLDFTPTQRRELGDLAARNGWTAEELTRATVKSLEEQFFVNAYDESSKHSEELRTALATVEDEPPLITVTVPKARAMGPTMPLSPATVEVLEEPVPPEPDETSTPPMPRPDIPRRTLIDIIKGRKKS